MSLLVTIIRFEVFYFKSNNEINCGLSYCAYANSCIFVLAILRTNTIVRCEHLFDRQLRSINANDNKKVSLIIRFRITFSTNRLSYIFTKRLTNDSNNRLKKTILTKLPEKDETHSFLRRWLHIPTL